MLQIVIFLPGKGAAKFVLVPKGAVNQKRLKNNGLDQACTTYGPQAKCGPRKLLIWPVILQIFFILPFLW